jgi:ferredoxin
MRVEIDGDRCAGHARCYALAPEVYEIDDDGYLATPSGEVPAGLEEQARRGADGCPERVITLLADSPVGGPAA